MSGDSAEARARRARIALVVAAALAFVLLRIPFLSVPLERDEGEYAYIAWRLLEGEAPYREAFDQKPPGVFFAYALAFVLFGESTEAIRGMAALWALATCAVLHALARRLLGGLGAAFAVLLLAVSAGDPRVLGFTANTELFALLPAVGAAACALRAGERDGSGAWLAAGALVAAAGIFKPVAVTGPGFALAFAWLAGAARRGPRRGARAAGVAAAGAALVLGPLALALAAADAWGAFVDAVVLHNLAYSGQLGWQGGWGALRHALAHQAPSFAPQWALAAAGLAGVGFARRRDRGFAAGWLLASAAGVAVGLYFRPHYFVLILPPLAVLAAAPLAAALRALLRRPSPAPAWAGGLAAVALAVGPPAAANADTLLAESPGAVARRIYGQNPFPESPAIGAHIRERSPPDATVLVVGSEPQILFHARRRSATRYIIFYPLTGDYPDAAARQRELVERVREAPPEWVVWVNLTTSLLVRPSTPTLVFEELATRVRREYRAELVARPEVEGGYAFVRGESAARLVGEGLGFLRSPWIVVWRRSPGLP